MDLLEFTDCELYFEEAMPARVESLIALASANYGSVEAELGLLQAFLLAPENLAVLVSLYRYYFYQHRLDDAETVAERAMAVTADRLGLPRHWQKLDEGAAAAGAARSFGMLRFYLLALKASAIISLRQGKLDDARQRLEKLMELDSRDQLGAGALMTVLLESDSLPPSTTQPHLAKEIHHG